MESKLKLSLIFKLRLLNTAALSPNDIWQTAYFLQEIAKLLIVSLTALLEFCRSKKLIRAIYQTHRFV
jgi:hypothetical protein